MTWAATGAAAAAGGATGAAAALEALVPALEVMVAYRGIILSIALASVLKNTGFSIEKYWHH